MMARDDYLHALDTRPDCNADLPLDDWAVCFGVLHTDARRFTAAPIRVYASPVVGKQPVTGGASPEWSGEKPHSACLAAFSCLGESSNGRPGGGSRKARRCSTGLATPVRSPTRLQAGARLQTVLEHTTMAHITQGASAPIFPSAFTPRESAVIKKALGIIEERRLRDAPLLYFFDDFQRYLVLRFAGLTNEQGHVLYLDINRRLLAAETEFIGDQSSVASWDIRKVVLRAITLGAEHVVFAHNHPSENPIPSEDDLRHLDWSIKALQPLKINLLDSYVVTSNGITSIRGHQKRIEEARWAERAADAERRSAERRAKIAATRARKAALRAKEESRHAA